MSERANIGASDEAGPGCDHEVSAERTPAAYAPAAFDQAAAIFRCLGDRERLRLLERLVPGEACVTELAGWTDASVSAVSQRLRVLRAEHLVAQRRAGKHVFYRLADPHVLELVRQALEHASEPPPHGKE
jgi:ArsR family transcriptional regulator, lead/cadmium/zinc/bismuth-responsive transcriptional repressor